MRLEDLVRNINTIDENLIIFQEEKLNIDSEIALFDSEEVGNSVVINTKAEYHYLLEVFIAREFINDWLETMSVQPTDKEIASRLFEYAINDA